ncbi:MAG: ROK family protein [Acidimicrobiia bacterium]
MLVAKRQRQPTPQPATPVAVASVVAELAGRFDAGGPVGCGFPGVVRHGVIGTAANLDPAWLDTHAATLSSDTLGGRTVNVINDADAAGLAEIRFGAGAGQPGVVVMITLGTGIGTAMFVDGILVPNTEFGHLMMDGTEAERLASTRAKEQNDLDWTQWTGHVLAFVKELERLMWPDMFIIGGGVSAEFQAFCESLRTVTPVAAAALGNDTGIVGAALAVSEDGA